MGTRSTLTLSRDRARTIIREALADMSGFTDEDLSLLLEVVADLSCPGSYNFSVVEKDGADDGWSP